jgi:hypothetical protein
MKHRAITFAFAACLISSFAFADNPTDAPLLPDDGNTTAVQQENQESHKPKRSKKKDKTTSAKAKSENQPKDDRQKEQSDPEYPATNGNYAGNN